jgi:ribosomal protein S7
MRKKKVIKRHSIKPDKKFNSTIVAQLINKVMREGEKRIATRIVYQAAEIIEKWFKEKLTTEKVTESKKTEKKNPLEMKKNELVSQAAEIGSTSELLKTSSSLFLTVLEGALANVKPSLETKRRKFGASNRRVPVKVEENRALILASR